METTTYTLEKTLESFPGNDNYKKPKEEYIRKVFAMSNADLRKECDSKIWLSAYASNNPKSDYHWQCDVCHEASAARDGGKAKIYKDAHSQLLKDSRG